jgi:hypothetical protein
MKRIDIGVYFIRDAVNRRLIDVHHIPRTENLANLFTKRPFRVDADHGGVDSDNIGQLRYVI